MDEIKALQEEFARAQMSGSASKLSERNCIQIIQKLQELSLIDLMYTTDGKEYLTYAHLERQVKDEIYVNGGRVTVVEIQESVSVDISRVEEVVQTVVKEDGDLHLIQSEIISSEYLDTIAVEINEILMESGHIGLAELCNRFNLPSDFLLQQLESRMGTIIQGQLDHFDRGSIFTDAFVARQTATILGVFSAITRPTEVSAMLAKYGFHKKLLDSVLQDLINSHKLAGSLQGQNKSSYVPDLQRKTQERWISSFFRSNNYIEYDAVRRLGIKNPKGHLKKIFPGGVALDSCYLDAGIQDTINASVQEALDTAELIDIQELLPPPCTGSDASALLTSLPILRKQKNARVLCNSTVCTDEYISKCAEIFKEPMEKKAKEISKVSKKKAVNATQKSPPPPAEPTKSVSFEGESEQKSKKDKRNDRKEKKSKRKAAQQDNENDDDAGDTRTKKQQNEEKIYTFMSEDELKEKLEKQLGECEEGVCEELANILCSQLNRRFQEYVRDAFLAGVETSSLKLDRSLLDEEYRTTYANARLFQIGAERFEGSEKDVLVKYLLKSLGQDMLNVLVRLRASEHFLQLDENAQTSMNSDQRTKIIQQMPGNDQVDLERLNSLLNDKEIDSYMDPLEDVAEDAGFVCKRNDKKRDRQVLFNHKLALLKALETETNPPMVLHLVAVLLFQAATGSMLHAPGKCVPSIVKFLKAHVDAEVHVLILDYQTLVMKSKTNDDEGPSGPTEEQTVALKKLLEKKTKA
eukprot:m.176742 g.176742  ORF g.176742 m.176742 type:complete len:750 (+) comp31855_c1_seq4:74-2323(+)